MVLLGALLLALLLRQIKRVAMSQRALRESEERYALAMEGANEGHWDWDVAGRSPVFVSPRMKVLARPERGQFGRLGQRMAEAASSMHEEDRPARRGSDAASILEGRSAAL